MYVEFQWQSVICDISLHLFSTLGGLTNSRKIIIFYTSVSNDTHSFHDSVSILWHAILEKVILLIA